MPYPVVPVTRPANLAGQSNGHLDGNLLVALGAPGRPNARAHRQTVRSFAALTAEVSDRFGETLTVTSTHDAYRSYAIQESTFRARYTTTVLEGRPRKWWQGQWWYQKPGTAMAAVPGTSNHGWGLALDVCLWRDGIVALTANSSLFGWLLANADLYGFSWEVQSEPWHLRLFSGDATPKAVIDHEKPPVPPSPPYPPLPPIEENEMTLIVRDRSTGETWCSNGVVRYRWPSHASYEAAVFVAQLQGQPLPPPVDVDPGQLVGFGVAVN